MARTTFWFSISTGFFTLWKDALANDEVRQIEDRHGMYSLSGELVYSYSDYTYRRA